MKYYSNVVQEALKGIDSSDIVKIIKYGTEGLIIAIFDSFDMKHRLLINEEVKNSNYSYKDCKEIYRNFIRKLKLIQIGFKEEKKDLGLVSKKDILKVLEEPEELNM